MSNSGSGALKLYCHEVTVRFVERAVVPPYEGSMIRGAFGRAFKLRLRDLAARGRAGVCEEQGGAAALRVRAA